MIALSIIEWQHHGSKSTTRPAEELDSKFAFQGSIMASGGTVIAASRARYAGQIDRAIERHLIEVRFVIV